MTRQRAIFLIVTSLLASATLAQSTQPTPASKPAFLPVQGQRVESYWVRQWWSATVRDVRGDQALVHYDQRAGSEDWVPLYTLRKFTKAGKYPMPATNDEIVAQGELETAARDARMDATLKPSSSRIHSRPGDPVVTPPRPRPTREDEFADADTSPIDTSSARILTDNPDLPIESLSPDPELAPKTIAPRPLALSGNPLAGQSRLALTPRPISLLAAPASAQLVAVQEVLGSRPVKLLQRFDAATGNPSPVAAIESSMVPNSVSPDATRVAGTSKFRKGHFGQPDAVEVWSLDRQPKLLVAFTPTTDEHEGHFVDLARFTDNDHVLTLTLGKLTLWEIPSAKAIYTRDLGRGASDIVVSPAGKYVAVADGRSARLLDAATGTLLGQLPPADPPLHPDHVAFSPTGKRLLASQQQRTVVYDLTKPAVVADIAMPAPLHGGVFLSDDYLLVSGRYVVDVAKSLVLWDYDHGEGPHRTLANRLWYLSYPAAPYTPSLYSAAIPTDEAIKAVASANPDDLYAVKPGTEVSLNLDTGLNADDYAQALKAVRAAATAAGWQITDNAPVKITASHSSADSKEITYRMFGGETRKVSAATHTYTLSVEQDGTTLWKTQTSLGPSFMVHLQKDQTIEQVLDEQRERSATAFYTSARFPKNLAKPTDHPGLGTTTLPGAADTATPPTQRPTPTRPRQIPRTRV